MKRSQLILVSIFVMLLLLTAVVLQVRRAGNSDTGRRTTLPDDAAVAANKKASAPPRPPPDVQAYGEKVIAEQTVRQKDLESQWNSQWSTPIEFYGKVVDENEMPVEAASIEFQWTAGDGQALRSSAASDSAGLFSINGIQSRALSIRVTKHGYQSSNAIPGTRFVYADIDGRPTFKPSLQSPVVFHIEKVSDAEPLVHGRKLFACQTNGSLQLIDLLQGKSVAMLPADLGVRFTRAPIGADNRYDWSVVLSVPEGGIMEAAAQTSAVAPATGYQPSIGINYRAADSTWTPRVKKEFFIVSRRGAVYARVQATLIPFYQRNAAMDLEYYVNPKSSRNLKFDPQKAIEPSAAWSSDYENVLEPKQRFYE